MCDSMILMRKKENVLDYNYTSIAQPTDVSTRVKVIKYTKPEDLIVWNQI